MKLKLILMMTVALLGFGFMRSDEAFAQEENICTTHCGQAINLDWQASSTGCNGNQVYYYTYFQDNAWRNCAFRLGANRRTISLSITYSIGDPLNLHTINNFDLSWQGNQAYGFDIIFSRCHNGSSGQCQSSANLTYTRSSKADLIANPIPTVEHVYNIAIRFHSIDVGATSETTSDGVRDMIVLNDIYFCSSNAMFECETPEYYQPLTEIVAELPTVDGVSVSSTLPGASVHAAADGTITAINPVSGNCINIDMIPCQDDAIKLNTDNSYIVHLQTEKVTFIYLLANAQNYVRVGISVTASCIMGETIAGNTREGHTSVGIINADAGTEAIVLTLSPLPESQPCIETNTKPPEQNCITGSQLSKDDWNAQGIHQWIGNSVQLSPGASIRQISALTDELETQLIFSASKSNTDGSGTVTAIIGTGNYTFTLTTLPDQYKTSSAIHRANASGYHEIKITNTSNQPITIHSTCVQIKIERLYPDECYFTNYDFSRGAFGWYLSSAVIAETGQVKIPVPQEGSISQPVEIFAGNDGYSYTLAVMVTLWFYPEYIADRNSTDTVQLSYSWYEVGTPTVIGTETFGAFGDGDDVVTFTKEFTIEDDIDDALQIQVDITTSDPDVRGITIREVCLSPEGDTWIGYEDSQLSNKKPFFEICRANPTPSGLNIGKWAEWMMNGILNLFSCELMKVFNGFWNWLQWLQLSIMEFINWIGETLLPWLGGHFFNLNFVQDILRTVQPVLDIFEMIIDAGISIFEKIVALIGNIVSLVIDFFNAWNNTDPIPPPFLPNCNVDPQLQNTCIIFWAFEVTILSGNLGQLIIPMFSANIAVLGTIYFIKRFQRLFERSARNV